MTPCGLPPTRRACAVPLGPRDRGSPHTTTRMSKLTAVRTSPDLDGLRTDNAPPGDFSAREHPRTRIESLNGVTR